MYRPGRRVPSPDTLEISGTRDTHPRKDSPRTPVKTRMHFSRMRTARLLTISCSARRGGSAHPPDADPPLDPILPGCRPPLHSLDAEPPLPGCRPLLDADPHPWMQTPTPWMQNPPPPLPGCRPPHSLDADPPPDADPFSGCRRLPPQMQTHLWMQTPRI